MRPKLGRVGGIERNKERERDGGRKGGWEGGRGHFGWNVASL